MKIKVSKSLVAQVANTEEGAETEELGVFICFVLYFAFSPKFLYIIATDYEIWQHVYH